ncbi:MAG: hypothetical protein WD271_01895 [Acidimicrobiia bacterium]
MDVEFVRVSERVCLARAVREDGALVETRATTKSGLPHDLEHLTVEAGLALHDGFWGRVAAGAEFKGMKITMVKPRRRPRALNRAIARGYTGWDDDLVGAVVNVYREARAAGWEPSRTFPQVPALTRLLRRGHGTRVGSTFEREVIERTCVSLRDAEGEWMAVPIGGLTTLT